MHELIKIQRLLKSCAGRQLDTEERIRSSIQVTEWLLLAGESLRTRGERVLQEELARMMEDPSGKLFTTRLSDQCFRSQNSSRTAQQIQYLLTTHGVPQFLGASKRLFFHAFRRLPSFLQSSLVPVMTFLLRREMSRVILPGEASPLGRHIRRRHKQGVRVNLNHLGEAILGEDEALKRLDTYISDLQKRDVEYISVKVSTICSQLNLLSWDATLERIAERLRILYRTAQHERYKRPDGNEIPKFVNLDMEEYRDLHLTIAVFQKVLDEEEFHEHAAGIVLQSYLPDSFECQKALTAWAQARVARGGAPIKIRIVKGANLAMEQVDASLHGWPQAPYDSKADVDANYKRMLEYGCQKEHASAVHIGVASHNLFDVAHAMLLIAENEVEELVQFEMLEGMADHLRKAVQQVAGGMLVYCPAAAGHEFQNAVAYLIRRLDENTAPQNFLRHQFQLRPGTELWQRQADAFSDACRTAKSTYATPRRTQDRRDDALHLDPEAAFCNEPDTDWSLEANRSWAKQLIQKFRRHNFGHVPLVIGAREVEAELRSGRDPSEPNREIYQYTVAGREQIEMALSCAVTAHQTWSQTLPVERANIAKRAAQLLRERRGALIGAMMADAGKAIPEADVELSEAIDFCEYYSRSLVEHHSMEGIDWTAKGPVVVTPPWNFPVAIPLGGAIAALLCGNSVIFKPAPETAYLGYAVASVLWDAGVPRDVLQLLQIDSPETGELLVGDSRVAAVILTGGTATARHFLELRNSMPLFAETGGKNAMIVSKLCDRDLAIKYAVQSAFGHAGQKCSATSVLILEGELYDDERFKLALVDAARSLHVGGAWDPRSEITPLIRSPQGTLERGLQELEEGEYWALEPRAHSDNPQLWSPGIKWGVRPGHFTQKQELFGPVLSVLRAESIENAIEIANSVDYGLTSGLHSLDPREQELWLSKIQAGNLYINRGTTGAIVQRQPFGGTKLSCYGRGSKAGGPNYLSQFMQAATSHTLGPVHSPPEFLKELYSLCGPEVARAAGSYSYWYDSYFSKQHDPSKLVGQDNLLEYRPLNKLIYRFDDATDLEDVGRIVAAAQVTQCPLELSGSSEQVAPFTAWAACVEENEEELIARLDKQPCCRLYLTAEPSEALWAATIPTQVKLHSGRPSSHGRVELLLFLREVSLCIDYHRYGNLDGREDEKRSPLPKLISRNGPKNGNQSQWYTLLHR